MLAMTGDGSLVAVRSISLVAALRPRQVLRGYLILVKVPPTHMVHPELLQWQWHGLALRRGL